MAKVTFNKLSDNAKAFVSNKLNLNKEGMASDINMVMTEESLTDDEKVSVLAYKFTANEAPILFAMWQRNNPVAPAYRFAYTFGVEIECGMNVPAFIRKANALGVSVNNIGRYTHCNDRHNFSITSDSSVHADNGTSCECVSPILDGNASGYDNLKKACEAINFANGNVNKTCGLHVHIGCADMTNEQYVNVFKNYQKLEGVIDSFMAKSRRANNNRYCASILRYNYSGCVTPYDVKRTMGCDRYHKVNPCSWDGHRTIEFRQHAGSTNYEKISHWANFVAKLVEYSRCNVLTETVRNIDEIPFITANEKAFFKARVNAVA